MPFIFKRIYSKEKRDEKIEDYYACEALKHAQRAQIFGSQVQSPEWLESIEKKSFGVVKDFCTCLDNVSYNNRILRIRKLKEECSNSIKSLINYKICKFYYKKTIGENTIENIRENLRDINECGFYYEECKRFLRSSNQKSNLFLESLGIKLEDLNHDIILQTSILEGQNSKLIAQDLLNKAVNDYETLSLDMIWNAVDWFKDSIVKTRDQDIECEAEVYSDLGYVYGKILKNENISKTHFKHAWSLAESLKPKVLTRFLWYKRLLKTIQKYQQEIVDEENKEFEEEKAKVLDEIKSDLDTINLKGSLDSYAFLAFAYEKYPPKKAEHKLDSPLNSSNIKKQLQKSVTHYHPDKNSKKEYGSAWYFIADAITKQLTRYYETMKSAS